jgi:hypothetical protein
MLLLTPRLGLVKNTSTFCTSEPLQPSLWLAVPRFAGGLARFASIVQFSHQSRQMNLEGMLVSTAEEQLYFLGRFGVLYACMQRDVQVLVSTLTLNSLELPHER